MRRGDRILELGSGPCFLAHRLLQRLPDSYYTALDLSPAVHELARARPGPWADRLIFLERRHGTPNRALRSPRGTPAVFGPRVIPGCSHRYRPALLSQALAGRTSDGSTNPSDDTPANSSPTPACDVIDAALALLSSDGDEIVTLARDDIGTLIAALGRHVELMCP